MRFISIAKIVILSFFFVSIFCNTQVWAAELIRQNEVTVNSEQTNLYINGNNVVVKSPTKKDLNVTAFSFNLNAPVERNLNVAASEVTINSVVDGSVKIVGGNIKLSGVFKEDVVIIGGQLDIREAVIEGDLIVGVVNLNIHSSKIKGNLIGNYSVANSDIKDQVRGQIDLKQTQDPALTTRDLFYYVNIASEFTVIIGLIICVFILKKRKKLLLNSPGFNINTGLDVLAGLLYLVLPFVFLIISLVLQLYPLIFTVAAIVYGFLILSNLFLPIYFASLLQNIFKLKYKTEYVVTFSYLLLLLINLTTKVLPYLGFIQIVVFALFLSSFGYIMRHLLTAFDDMINNFSKSN